MIWTFLWAVYAVRIHLGLVIKVNSIFMTTRQDLEPHFPILNNSNVLVVSGLLWGTVCPVCGLFAVKFVKYEVANDIPVPMGKENPIYDLPRGILHTVYHRLFSQRKWWDSCCPNHLNPICGCLAHYSVERILWCRDGIKLEILHCSLWFQMHCDRLQRADRGHLGQLHSLKKGPFFTITWKLWTEKKPPNWNIFHQHLNIRPAGSPQPLWI